LRSDFSADSTLPSASTASIPSPQAQRKITLGVLGSPLNRRQHAAGFHRHRKVCGIELADAIEPAQRQHHLRAGVIGRRPATVAGVPALWHQADAALVAPGRDRGDLLDAARQQHRQCTAMVEAAVIDLEALHFLGPSQYGLGADQRAQLLM
jgi:hypothetical protein